MSPTIMGYELATATGQTLYMVGASTIFAVLLGLPLGTILFSSHALKHQPSLFRIISALINIARSIPFIILLVALIPITRFLVGTSIGTHAAIVPLTLGAAPFFARLVDNIYRGLPAGLLEAGFAMGSSTWQMIRHILLPEARPAIIQAITVTSITLVNYSAMSGTVGGGGLGDLAIRQRFDLSIMIITVMILVFIVQAVQWIGDRSAAAAQPSQNARILSSASEGE